MSTLLFFFFSCYIYTTISISYMYPYSLQFVQEMNISTSECSSRCESGWTTYLDHLSNSTNPYNYQWKGANVIEDQEDEGQSMVSDASSGPPHSLENCGFASPAQESRKKSQQKIRTRETRMKQQHKQSLDDTASSPVLQFSQDNAVQCSTEYFSQADFEEEATQKKNITFFKSSIIKGKSGSLLGRKRQ